MNLAIFILAAGLGERLQPITNYIPKPLVPLAGKPVLHTILDKISNLSANKIGINLCHKKEAIESWINHSPFKGRIELFPEDPALGTGGALKNAEDFLKDNIFLVHNSDIISDVDLAKLVDYHLSSKNLATLAVHDYPNFNKIVIDETGFFKKIVKAGSGAKSVAFTGIAVYSPAFLELLPTGVSSVVDAWEKALSRGFKIGTFDVSGCHWTDIGTPSAYAKAVVRELKNNGETVYIHPSVKGCGHIELDGYAVIEKDNEFDVDISLGTCILLPGSKVESDSKYFNCILGPGFKIDLDESDLFASSDRSGMLISTGGSDRKYYRVERDDKTAVFMKCPGDDPDFQRHIEFTHFFQKYHAPVPELIDVYFENKTALFEDVGDISLYSWLKCPRDRGHIEEIYSRAIDILVLIHTEATEHAAECILLQNRVFDYEHLRWETRYFMERFVETVGNTRVKNASDLNDDFHRLAERVDSFPKTIIHRDFQSQNLMVAKGGIIRLLDFQGARIGPPAYDVASLLWDPYSSIPKDLRERLLAYYVRKITVTRLPFKADDFLESLLACRLQRHMQALGAYGFLSTVKGKKYFMKYVPEGLRLLKEDIALSNNEYPALYELVKDL